MSLPSKTSTFRSGVHTRLALSSAFSPTLNPRCLEGNFAPAWISTLNDATAFSDRFSVETEPSISIPGNFVQDLELDAQSEEMLNRRHLLVSLMEQDEETAVPDPSGTILRKSLRLKNTKDITKQWRETEIRLIAAFNDRFLRSNVYLLATPTSDAQINLMTREMKRIAGQCDPTFRNNLPTALNFQLLPDCPRRCATCDV